MKKVAVVFSGGYDTDPRDHGRPVVLVAAGLGVKPEVFRKAFSGVTPAPAGQEPVPGQVRRNKEALLSVLGPYGVTNERLDEVSDYYRYRPGPGELWRHQPASAVATVSGGKITGFTITDPGAGYTVAPTATVPGVKQQVKVTIGFSKDLAKNGRIVSLKAR